VRPSAFGRAGGDLTQALFTKRALEACGVTVEMAATLDPDARGYDLAHLFGVFDPGDAEKQLAACKRANVPVVLSPLWWPLLEFYGHSRACDRILGGDVRRIESRLARVHGIEPGRFLRRGERRNYARRLALQIELMRAADVLLPNSVIEEHLIRKLELQDRPIVVVHQALDIPVIHSPSPARRGVLCVGRIEPKKNQAMLLYALRDVDVDIELVGACYEPEYMKLCRRFMTPRVRWTDMIERDEVLRMMSSAAVHVLPSWAEFPGIASVEAAAMGAHVIVSNDGTECEYFGELAQYVDPRNPRGIRTAIVRALSLPPRQPNDELTRRLQEFTVEAVGERTLRGYRIALSAN
jgi:glycosyltransferase involved in cell wall biosynthesis